GSGVGLGQRAAGPSRSLIDLPRGEKRAPQRRLERLTHKRRTLRGKEIRGSSRRLFPGPLGNTGRPRVQPVPGRHVSKPEAALGSHKDTHASTNASLATSTLDLPVYL
uniref:Uncharacterized protein n=1 Tax=Gadus morhua TaxID=8049 RepID=A0A8C5C516_GADMO